MKLPDKIPKSRDTGTGKILELMIIPSLASGGYKVSLQQNIGQRFGGGRHFVDVVAEDNVGRKFLISLKWQQVSGTAEQKVPFEAICLTEAVVQSSGEFSKAYLVLGGEGWRLREFFTKGGLDKHLTHGDRIDIITLEGFVAKANRGDL